MRSSWSLLYILFATEWIGSSSWISNPIQAASATGILKLEIPSRNGVALFASNEKTSFDVMVMDNVFSTDACLDLDELAYDHAERGQDGSSIFDRRANRAQWTPIEHALDSYLQKVKDPNHIVEYWSRNEHLNMDAHVDIDEEELEEDQTLRYPEWGHVLYMDVEDHVRGPTCVLDQFGGWTKSEVSDESVTLITVPAVQGRVLRFPGSAMHAVPKPCNRWLMAAAEENELRTSELAAVKEGKEDSDDEEADAEYDSGDEDDEYDDNKDEEYDERSVLLFNTWANKGPRDVFPDYISGILPDGIAVDDDADESVVDTEETRMQGQIKEWEGDYGPSCENLHCNDFSEWKAIAISEAGEATQQVVRVSLMGNRERRLHPEKYAELVTPSDAEEALAQQHAPFKIVLNRSSE